YVGGHSAVWRSDDGGVSWRHPEWRPVVTGGATPPGALLPPNVYDLAIPPQHPDVVFAPASPDMPGPPYEGVYRSTDGAQTWTRVHRFVSAGGAVGFVGGLSMAPDNPDLIYAAGSFAVGRSADGGTTWSEIVPPGSGIAVNQVAAAPATAAG